MFDGSTIFQMRTRSLGKQKARTYFWFVVWSIRTSLVKRQEVCAQTLPARKNGWKSCMQRALQCLIWWQADHNQHKQTRINLNNPAYLTLLYIDVSRFLQLCPNHTSGDNVWRTSQHLFCRCEQCLCNFALNISLPAIREESTIPGPWVLGIQLRTIL